MRGLKPGETFLGNVNLKKAGVAIPYSEEDIREIIRCKEVGAAEDDIRGKMNIIRVQIEGQSQIDRIRNSVSDKIRDISIEISLKSKTVKNPLSSKDSQAGDSEIQRR